MNSEVKEGFDKVNLSRKICYKLNSYLRPCIKGYSPFFLKNQGLALAVR